MTQDRSVARICCWGVCALLFAGMCLLAASCDQSASLLEAARRGDEVALKKSLEQGADPNCADSLGNTALHIAAKKPGAVRLVYALIEAGANVNAKNTQGWTPLHRTLEPQVAQALIDHGADLRARDSMGSTPLHTAVSGWLRLGAVNNRNGEAVTHGHGLAFQEAISALRNAVVRILLENGADLNARDNMGRAPLHIAARDGFLNEVRLLVSHGADPRTEDYFEGTALHVAENQGHEDVAKYLRSQMPGRNPEKSEVTKPGASLNVGSAVALLASGNPAERRSAARILGECALEGVTPELRKALPTLVKALDDQELSVRQEVAFTLARMGPEASPAVPALTETLKDDVPPVRSMAAVALGAIGPPAKQAVASLAQAGDAGFLPLRKAAVVALGEIGPDAKAAVPALVGALKDDNAYVRWRAAQAIGRIRFSDENVASALEKGLRDENPLVQVWCASALQKLQPAADKGLDHLLRLLKAEDAKVREAAVQAIGAAGPAAGEAAAALIEAFNTVGRAGKMDFLADALRDIGPAGIDALIQALKHGDAETRRRAIWALDWIGPPAKKAVPALKEAVQDPRLQYMAEKALKEIQGEQSD